MLQKVTLLSAALTTVAGADLRTAPNDKKITNAYVVRLEDAVDRQGLESHIAGMRSIFSETDYLPKHIYGGLADKHRASYSVQLTPRGLERLLKHEQVKYIEEDEIVTISDCRSQTDEDWGTARINHRNYNSSQTYSYDYTTGLNTYYSTEWQFLICNVWSITVRVLFIGASGLGVDAYIIDTGIYCENNDFVEKKSGTCTFGYSVVEENGVIDETDGNGHGTHCAGTVGGQRWGAAKEVNLIAVKVLSDAGSGTKSQTIAGVDWVVEQAQATGKKSLANLSLGGSFSEAQNDALAAAYDAGVLMVVAAGNDNYDACRNSPASEPTAVTVAASDINNARASYSNYGSCVDIFGPGSAITSAWIGSPDATNTISGTSMATPQVCGTAAKFLSADSTLTPATLTQKLIDDADKDEISNVRGSPNLMWVPVAAAVAEVVAVDRSDRIVSKSYCGLSSINVYHTKHILFLIDT